MLTKFWKHESAGLYKTQYPEEKKTDNGGVDINFKDGRYTVRLPFKDDLYRSLPSNYELSKKQLGSLFSKLITKTDLLKQYDEIFQQQLSDGIIEEVSQENIDKQGSHFLCHFGVIRNDRETRNDKLRIVFEGSAKNSQENLSLNDCLETGENSMLHLFNTLIRFCTKPIVLTANSLVLIARHQS